MTRKPRVLIIEDDSDMIELLTLILKKGGYEALPALGGQEGLHLLQEHTVHLILLDLMMEDMSGWQVLEAIQDQPRLRDIPVLIVSARHHLEDLEQTSAHADQFEGYLVKPFLVRNLLAQVQEALA